jgi:hypothetical protein
MTVKKILFILLAISGNLQAQLGGPTTYRFLDIPMPARAAALGGSAMSIAGDDINLYFSNPALLNKYCVKQLALNYSNYVADMNFGNVAYAYHFEGVGTVAAGLQYFNYGKFERRDEFDVMDGNFKAADYALNLSIARKLKDTSFSFGLTLKTIYSHYDIYNSFGNTVDIGINYVHKSGFTASLAVKNVGMIWNTYGPLDTAKIFKYGQVGISHKLKKAPFRLILVCDNIALKKWDLGYESPLDEDNTSDPFNNEPVKEKTKWQKFSDRTKNNADRVARHFIVATEVVITKSFNLRVGYNYRLHKELMLPDKRTASGLSLGFGFGVNRFTINYAFTKMSLNGNSHIFGITTNLGTYVKKQKPVSGDTPPPSGN